MVNPLNRKLTRDLWRIKGQAIAIGLVIAFGVLMLVMMDGLVNTLEETRRAYYDRYRMAEVFAPVKRAPKAVLDELVNIAGVKTVQGRITGAALVHLPGVPLPLQAQAVSLPDHGAPSLNTVFIASGRMLNPEHANEILLLNSFAEARGLALGDKLKATINGTQTIYRIVGLAQSPEFVYTTAPGELAAIDGSFATIWIGERALAAIYDMDGAFDEALLSLSRDARLPAVINTVNRVLENYGGLGAYGREDQLSNRFVSEEIAGLRVSAVATPPIFLGVAAFLLYIVVSRMVQAEREQIGLLKAFGYSSFSIGFHYLKLVLVIAVGGAIVGSVLGVSAGRAMAGFYQLYFKFPFIVFQINAATFIVGFCVSIMTASLGGLWVLRSVFALTPAVAMSPPAPADFSHTGQHSKWFMRQLDQPSRMVLRRLLRQPGRMAGAIIGIASGMSLSVGMISVMSGFDTVIDLTFNHLNRSDTNVVFTHPLSSNALYELSSLKGVLAAEGVRDVQVVFRHGLKEYRGAINGLADHPKLYRALDKSHQPVFLGQSGLVISSSLAKILNANPGDHLTVEVREGKRTILEIPVSGVANTLLGSPAYMDIDALNRVLKEPGHISGAYLRIDQTESDNIYRAIKNMPHVAGIGVKQNSKDAFETLMDTGAGAMRFVMVLIAGVITFGIVYNSARIAFAERERDIACLRVIGFTKGEAAFVLLGELAAVTLLALPLGALFGYYLSIAISKGFSTEIYQIPPSFSPESYGTATLAVIVASVISGWLVKRDIDQLDMVLALKSKE